MDFKIAKSFTLSTAKITKKLKEDWDKYFFNCPILEEPTITQERNILKEMNQQMDEFENWFDEVNWEDITKVQNLNNLQFALSFGEEHFKIDYSCEEYEECGYFGYFGYFEDDEDLNST